MAIPDINFWLQGRVTPNWSDDYQNYRFHSAKKSHDRSIKWTSSERYSDQQPLWLQSLLMNFNFDHESWTLHRVLPSTMITKNSTVDVAAQKHSVKITVFLEDWQPGNYCEFQGQTFVNWHAGSFFAVPADCDFIDCNFGHHPRYTLELRGLL